MFFFLLLFNLIIFSIPKSYRVKKRREDRRVRRNWPADIKSFEWAGSASV
jgi:hypothetical protein